MAGHRSALNYNKFLLLLLSGIRPNIYSYTSRSDFMILYISPHEIIYKLRHWSTSSTGIV